MQLKMVKRIAGLTIEWMKSLLNTAHPMSGYVPMFISVWEQGARCHQELGLSARLQAGV